MTLRSGSGVRGRTLVAGSGEGPARVLEAPLSLWGGMDPRTGRVIDRRHPQHGADLRGRVLLMPGGRGSSSSSSVLAEAVRAGTAPAAIVLLRVDPIVALGAVVSGELYGAGPPVVVLEERDYGTIEDDEPVRVDAAVDGSATVTAG
jgi:predicted aconitase with swiveling domain